MKNFGDLNKFELTLFEFHQRCQDNFLQITDSTGTYTSCGTEKKTFVNKFCSNKIYISYKATATLGSYKGFKLYFEGNFLSFFIIFELY